MLHHLPGSLYLHHLHHRHLNYEHPKLTRFVSFSLSPERIMYSFFMLNKPRVRHKSSFACLSDRVGTKVHSRLKCGSHSNIDD